MIPKSPENKSLNNKTLSNKFWENINRKVNGLKQPLLPLRKNETNRHSESAKSCFTEIHR